MNHPYRIPATQDKDRGPRWGATKWVRFLRFCGLYLRRRCVHGRLRDSACYQLGCWRSKGYNGPDYTYL